MAIENFLVGFENALWYLAIGLLISGGLLVILSVVLNLDSFAHALGIGDHDVSVDHDFSADHDVSVADHDISVDHDISIADHDISIDHDLGVGDHDISVDHEIGISDHDISVDHDVGVGDHDISTDLDSSEVHFDSMKDITHTSAPIFLLMSTYFLMFGILGVSTLKISSSSIGLRIFRIILIIISPYLLALSLTHLWRRISTTKVKPIKRGVQLIGMIGTVYVSVDNRGGIIHVDLGEGLGTQKLHAVSAGYHDKFEREEEVRIVAVKDRVYLVDKI
ncbi:MAG: NfeD family protein [Candidatus Heimdallarchaeota archaeon]|nr:NfeD family protein [Candidatus Heimdallarchaeota archaeon]MCK4955021.1 NfeD family protein [Candidatus Heimdallarchaeota archaeon]